ncbi:uncharacterized protein ARMOST_13976 [Armillaria ostoyae]|uniref:Uncharacterized protein n=1 Tax=Armillaria ostoyae TaxID=47428 RepID=A0A284RPD2_ARMOS|nr:uncharacterized protein ARMOST_13976 [Armillaria ostoyae]
MADITMALLNVDSGEIARVVVGDQKITAATWAEFCVLVLVRGKPILPSSCTYSWAVFTNRQHIRMLMGANGIRAIHGRPDDVLPWVRMSTWRDSPLYSSLRTPSLPQLLESTGVAMPFLNMSSRGACTAECLREPTTFKKDEIDIIPRRLAWTLCSAIFPIHRRTCRRPASLGLNFQTSWLGHTQPRDHEHGTSSSRWAMSAAERAGLSMCYNLFVLSTSLRDDPYPIEPANYVLLMPTWHLENQIVHFAKSTFTLRGQD